MSAIIGVDLGGTKTSAGLVESDGTVSRRRESPTPSHAGRDAVLDAVAEVVAAVVDDARAAGTVVDRIGVGAAGVIDPETGVIVSATDTIEGWRGTDLRAELSRRLGVGLDIVNDVHAHALGEHRLGAGRGRGSMLLVTVGTGIGGAYLSGGTLHAGAHWLAGHLGHIPSIEAEGILCACGRRSHLEPVASGLGIHASYLRLGGSPALADTRALFAELAERPESKDARAADAAIRLGALALGRALGGWLNTFDPEIVVLGGSVARQPLWWEQVLEAAAGETLLPFEGYRILPPALGSDSGIVGAAEVARDRGASGVSRGAA